MPEFLKQPLASNLLRGGFFRQEEVCPVLDQVLHNQRNVLRCVALVNGRPRRLQNGVHLPRVGGDPAVGALKEPDRLPFLTAELGTGI